MNEEDLVPQPLSQRANAEYMFPGTWQLDCGGLGCQVPIFVPKQWFKSLEADSLPIYCPHCCDVNKRARLDIILYDDINRLEPQAFKDIPSVITASNAPVTPPGTTVSSSSRRRKRRERDGGREGKSASPIPRTRGHGKSHQICDELWLTEILDRLMTILRDDFSQTLPLVQREFPGCSSEKIAQAFFCMIRQEDGMLQNLPDWMRGWVETRFESLKSELKDVQKVVKHIGEQYSTEEMLEWLSSNVVAKSATIRKPTMKATELPEPVFKQHVSNTVLLNHLLSRVQECRQGSPQAKPNREKGDFICPFCTADYKAKDALDKHWQEHDPHKVISCSLCNKCFVRSDRFYRHLKFDHTIIDKVKQKEERLKNSHELEYTRQCPFCKEFWPSFQQFFKHYCEHCEDEVRKVGRRRGSSSPSSQRRRSNDDESDSSSGDDNDQGGDNSANFYLRATKRIKGSEPKQSDSGAQQSQGFKSCAYTCQIPDDISTSVETSNDGQSTYLHELSSATSECCVDVRTNVAKDEHYVPNKELVPCSSDQDFALCGEKFTVILDALDERDRISRPFQGFKLSRKSLTWPQDRSNSSDGPHNQAEMDKMRSKRSDEEFWYTLHAGELYLSPKEIDVTHSINSQTWKHTFVALHINFYVFSVSDKRMLSRLIIERWRITDRRYAALYLGEFNQAGWEVQSHGKNQYGQRKIQVLEHLTQAFKDMCRIEDASRKTLPIVDINK